MQTRSCHSDVLFSTNVSSAAKCSSSTLHPVSIDVPVSAQLLLPVIVLQLDVLLLLMQFVN